MIRRMAPGGSLPARRTAGIRRHDRQLPPDRANAGGISIFYDVGQGQGWQRNIVMNAADQHPPMVRRLARPLGGHTLVVDVTNFSAKTDYQGSRENLLSRREA